MARKKEPQEKQHVENPKVMGLHAAVVEQPICDTLERNYMPCHSGDRWLQAIAPEAAVYDV